MTKAVWKYHVPFPCDYFALTMPRGAQPLDVQIQGDNFCMWALVDPKEPQEDREFRLCGTGHPIAETLCRHIATIQDGRDFVWHIFDLSGGGARRFYNEMSDTGPNFGCVHWEGKK